MTPDELDAAVADAVAQCEGDVLATVRMLLVVVDFWHGLAGRLKEHSPMQIGASPSSPHRCVRRSGGIAHSHSLEVVCTPSECRICANRAVFPTTGCITSGSMSSAIRKSCSLSNKNR